MFCGVLVVVAIVLEGGPCCCVVAVLVGSCLLLELKRHESHDLECVDVASMCCTVMLNALQSFTTSTTTMIKCSCHAMQW